MIVPCKHHSGGRCSMGLYGGRPSPGVCLLHCEQFDGEYDAKQQAIVQLKIDVPTQPGGRGVRGCGSARQSTIDHRISICRPCPHNNGIGECMKARVGPRLLPALVKGKNNACEDDRWGPEQ